ncbi:purine-cytosine permease fcy22 protein [Apiospora saccharicola]|uniref:Purine-cytosine permease fcy22 protein n=1 Tax=Apiospora saccharicola TaxID=335842 RepID=A0ABR1UNN9_9PEZI
MASEIPHEKEAHLHDDVEAGAGYRKHGGLASFLAVEDGVVYKPGLESNPRWYQRLLDAGVEDNGVKPVPVESRTDTRYHNLFTVFSTALLCVLPIPTGMLGTTAFGMSLRDASLTILYSWGLYIVTLPLLLNAATVTGFTLISAIVGGQTIAAINPGHVSVDVGIIITILIGFGVSFLGFRALHAWERWSWIPNLIALVITVGCGGKFLVNQAEAAPVTTPQVISYAGLIAGYFITFGGTASDYSVYYNPKASKVKIFSYIYLGLLTPSVPLLVLGAAMGGAVPVVEGWSDAYDAYGAGGVLAAMLEPAHGFGKFVLVLLALSVLGQLAISMYSIALNLQMLVPIFTKVPRYAFIIVVSVVMIPIGIKVAEQWETSLENFLALIGYWAGCFDAVLLEEFLVFRRRDYATYDHAIWNVGGKLPSGIAALAASLLSMGLVIPGMAEAWYTGPIAEKTGDIGFEMAFFVTGIFYLPFRWLEIKWRGHL